MILEEKFAGFIDKAYGEGQLDKAGHQYQDLKDAFIGGALVTFVYLLGCRSTADLKRLQDDLETHGMTVSARAEVFGDILEAGKQTTEGDQ
jgi:hypothetical protein